MVQNIPLSPRVKLYPLPLGSNYTPSPGVRLYPPFSWGQTRLLLIHPHSTQITFNLRGLQMDTRCRHQATGKRDGGGGSDLSTYLQKNRLYKWIPLFFCAPLFKKTHSATSCLDLNLSNYFYSHGNSPIGPLDFLNLNS